jgi:hypothetical protein
MAEGVQMPTYLNYGEMLNMNPYAYGQAQQQVDLARLFQDQALQQEQNRTTKGTLENDYNRGLNPLLLQHQKLSNTGLDLRNQDQSMDNSLKQTKVNIDTATRPQQQELAVKKIANAITDEELTTWENEANKMLQSPDPKVQSEGLRHKEFFRSVMAERMKQDAISQGQIAVDEAQLPGKIQVAQIGADARRDIANIGAQGKITVETLRGKTAQEIAAIKQTLAQRLATLDRQVAADPNNPDLRQQQAETFQQLQTANAAYGGAINTGAMGVPRNAQSDPTGTGAPVPPAAPVAPKAPVPAYDNQSMSYWRNLYPGVSDDAIRKAAAAKGYKIKD